MNYYNEFNPEKAEWLRELIKVGVISEGEVDERSIKEVKASELVRFRQCHFFAGIGGWSYALRLAGWPDGKRVWTGSCPCQPFSGIGEKKGFDDERHLWPAFHQLIDEYRRLCGPIVTFGEQVASPDGLGWLDGVFTDLEASGYTCESFDLCSAGVGCPTIRQRLYWVGYTIGKGLERHSGDEPAGGDEEEARPYAETGGGGVEPASVDALPVLRRMDMHDPQDARSRLRLHPPRGVADRSLWSRFDALPCSDGWRRVQPGTFPLAHGIPGRVGLLRGYGDAINPEVAARFIEAWMQAYE